MAQKKKTEYTYNENTGKMDKREVYVDYHAPAEGKKSLGEVARIIKAKKAAKEAESNKPRKKTGLAALAERETKRREELRKKRGN